MDHKTGLNDQVCSLTMPLCDYKLDVWTYNQLGNLTVSRFGTCEQTASHPSCVLCDWCIYFLSTTHTCCRPFCTHTQHQRVHSISWLSKHDDSGTSSTYPSFCWHYKFEWLGFERPQPECCELQTLTQQISHLSQRLAEENTPPAGIF